MDLKRETDSSTIIIRDFTTPLTSMGRLLRQKISKGISALNNIFNQINI